ncbi:redoxin domain-containing protein [Natronobacterium gregoryi]|uniref:Alkyl hydroperoxide reductase/ Thiol specific antioxidant/ Mal allergen n=2 Tax=Natronobacterium gregoryi TaxID=44930 RepID=L0AFE8_NATGS|nr:redoxin domain-containing protein [Natronobacterium gregoryi]AFZ72613.1 Peroxiredoxin [Natronobacterium gregoryi SP2]ELY71959.1 alkyl hydroperoxide reductase/ Thiol specific antioxidant/ Mal allergen [Natronobacterium gregoryi SP2]PLK19213.1 peroxiredoxin [Natronobacterium gregoryi SP2]SFJ57625.1 Peroxiredoxin [Natronobacterium gregoryi]
MIDFEVVPLDATDHLDAGDEVPAFTRPLVTDEYWEDVSLPDLVEGSERTILVFTPMAGSFLAKYVWDELTERGWNEADARVVGITAANPYSVKRFIDAEAVPFEFFADPANEVAEKYGFAHDLDGMAGVSEPRLAFVAVDEDLAVETTWVAEEWPEFPDYDELENDLGLA